MHVASILALSFSLLPRQASGASIHATPRLHPRISSEDVQNRGFLDGLFHSIASVESAAEKAVGDAGAAFAPILDVTGGGTTTMPIVNRVVAPDGFARPSVLAGSSFPGPLITARKGQSFRINVANQLNDTSMETVTTIHWHGFFQSRTPWEDGVAFVSQCPIVPRASFVYDFSTAKQAGTFWYHSHYSTQYCDGLRGAMVVYDPRDPHKSLYDVDDATTVITLADWYHYLSTNAPFIPKPSSTLINGLGRYPGGPASPLSVINVKQGKRYRFRVVAMSCDSSFDFSIDGHTMTIIEVDSINHKPLIVDQITIYAGQRYSVIITANQPVGNYWVRANPDVGNTGRDGGINSAIFRYAGAQNTTPTTTAAVRNPMVETSLHPLVASPAPGKPYPGGADITFNLDITFNGHFAVNGKSFSSPGVPVLLQILSGLAPAQNLLPTGSVISLPPNKVVEISVPGGTVGAPHPFHLHGHAFWVVRSAGSDHYNFVDPVIRDVVSTGASKSDNTTFRFVTDNAGPWILHCHIDWHLDIGLAVVFAEDIPSVGKERPPISWQSLCPAYNKFIKS
ncbi:unnamed protein product [Mycena citricolor]|uniref:laccase n=1 Tax=Mycena citricolor TaxID=2018698 RepID=A0AAD2K4H8_9AGAR|nr:unnamed protein product [Mycena citricolor]